MPINTAALPNLSRQLLRRNPDAGLRCRTGERCLPSPTPTQRWGQLIYDRQQIKDASESISALWDPRYQQGVAFNDGTHNFSRHKHWDSPPFLLRDQDWPAVVTRRSPCAEMY